MIWKPTLRRQTTTRPLPASPAQDRVLAQDQVLAQQDQVLQHPVLVTLRCLPAVPATLLAHQVLAAHQAVGRVPAVKHQALWPTAAGPIIRSTIHLATTDRMKIQEQGKPP